MKSSQFDKLGWRKRREAFREPTSESPDFWLADGRSCGTWRGNLYPVSRRTGGRQRRLGLRQFKKDAPGSTWVNKGDKGSLGASPRFLVEQRNTRGLEPIEHRRQIVDLEAEMVEAGSAPGQKSTDGSL